MTDQLVAAVDDIIEGRTVKRSVHLLIHEGEDLRETFVERLSVHGYARCKVADIDVKWGQRVPAFVIRNETAYFGWVFVEKFTEAKSRKLFGSLIKNNKGDWTIQISGSNPELIYANLSKSSGMESDTTFILE